MFAIAVFAVLLASQALSDQNADSLIPVIYSLEAPLSRYLARGYSVLQPLLSPVEDYSVNLRLHVLARATCFLFVPIWLMVKIADFFPQSRSVVYSIGTLALVAFTLRYPVIGESLIHGSNAPMVASCLLICGAHFRDRRLVMPTTAPGRNLVASVVEGAAYFAATWTWAPVLLWAPLLLSVGLLSRGFGNFTLPRLRNGGASFRYVSSLLLLVLAALSYVIAQSGESGSRVDFSVDRAVRGTRFAAILWNPEHKFIREWLQVALVLFLVSSAVLLLRRKHIRDSWQSAAVVLLSLWAAASASVMAGLSHVEENLFHPRYFAASLLIGNVALAACAAGLVWGQLRRPRPPLELRAHVEEMFRSAFSKKSVIALVFLACSVLCAFYLTRPISFGLSSSNAFDMNMVGDPPSIELITRIESAVGANIDFVAGSHWDVWPTIFVAGEHGKRIPALSEFEQGTGRLANMFSRETSLGLCLVSDVSKCREYMDIAVSSLGSDYGQPSVLARMVNVANQSYVILEVHTQR